MSNHYDTVGLAASVYELDIVGDMGMTVALYEPDGTLNGYFVVEYAIEYCRTHPGWTWGYVE